MKARREVAILIAVAAIGLFALLPGPKANPADDVRPVALPFVPGEVPGADAPTVTPEAPGRHSILPERERAETRDVVEFTLLNLRDNTAAGFVSVFPTNGECRVLPFSGTHVVLTGARLSRRVEIDVPGYAVAQVQGPFLDTEGSFEVPLLLAGEIAVGVVDSTGRCLADMAVSCNPLRVDRTGNGERVSQVVTRYAKTDTRGQAVLIRVLPGTYRVDTPAVAEWSDGVARNIEVVAGLRSDAKIVVNVRDEGSYGGFVLPRDQATFLTANYYGVVKDYQFWDEENRSHKLFLIQGEVRCVVSGSRGAVVGGRIKSCDAYGRTMLPSKATDRITVTIGAMVRASVHWSEARD